MSRSRKLLIVSLVLVLGLGLAWPFRNAAPQFGSSEPSDTSVRLSSEAVAFRAPAPQTAETTSPVTQATERHVAATMTSTGEGAPGTPFRTSFDLEDHPALAQQNEDEPPRTFPAEQRPTEAVREARPAYATSPPSPADEDAWPGEVIHVVHNGDTLEKLAQRYLGDSGRALELFDLNRDQLSNPHLLPIGAELRIPVPPHRDAD